MRVFLIIVKIFLAIAVFALWLWACLRAFIEDPRDAIVEIITAMIFWFIVFAVWDWRKSRRDRREALKELKDDINASAMADLMGVRFVSDTEVSLLVQQLRNSNQQLWEHIRKLEEDLEDKVLIEQLFEERYYLKKQIQKFEQKR